MSNLVALQDSSAARCKLLNLFFLIKTTWYKNRFLEDIPAKICSLYASKNSQRIIQ